MDTNANQTLDEQLETDFVAAYGVTVEEAGKFSDAATVQPFFELPDIKGKTLDDCNGKTPVVYLTGQAGTGKTYGVRQHIERDPKFGCLCATTGVAAVNLGAGVPTIHSLLGFGNTTAAMDAYNSGNMLRRIRQLADQGFLWIIVDEASMLHYKILDYVYLAMEDYNNTYDGKQVLGLILTGDILQLPPVGDKLVDENGREVVSKKSGKPVSEPTPWLFKADCWEEFAANTIKLTEIKRQNDPEFVAALNYAREGNGKMAVEKLKAAGAKFRMLLNPEFDGTTILSTNAEVDRFNRSSLLKVQGEKFSVTSERWCAKQYPPAEWKNVPDVLELKVGALVMLLQNDTTREKRYVNGDLGHIVGVIRARSAVPLEEPEDFSFVDKSGDVEAIEVELLRTGEKVFISKVTRPTYQLTEPEMDYIPPGPNKDKIRKDRVPGMVRKVWILGELEYFPLRLAYATTVHKSQGLTLDKVQIHPKDFFFGAPQMAYVALSRCRTADGLTIVGGEKLLEGKINTDPKLKEYL